jgi:hypothetical protein
MKGPQVNRNERIKYIIQDCNLNFLVGSGLSSPYLRTLGDIETLLTEVAEKESLGEKARIIRASLYKKYFDGAIVKNLNMLEGDEPSKTILATYCSFLTLINSILLKRKSTILSKEANIFTTNVDVFLERALEDIGVEYNDGFNGRFRPLFSLSNFKKSRSKRSLHYDNTSELPVFNLLKLHGSLCWKLAEEDIIFSTDLAHVWEIREKKLSPNGCVEIQDGTTIDALLGLADNKTADESTDSFLKAYEKLLIINPTKEKFKQSLMNETHYEMLRMYSNELERENTVLFVMGFSFADAHIRALTLRAANSNPTLMVYVFAHSSNAKIEMLKHFEPDAITNQNIDFIAPLQTEDAGTDDFNYDLATINSRVFGRLFEEGEERIW